MSDNKNSLSWSKLVGNTESSQTREKFENQQWVLFSKEDKNIIVWIFSANGDFDIFENGASRKNLSKWKYVNPNSDLKEIIIEDDEGRKLFKKEFMDSFVLKLIVMGTTDSYTFINEKNCTVDINNMFEVEKLINLSLGIKQVNIASSDNLEKKPELTTKTDSATSESLQLYDKLPKEKFEMLKSYAGEDYALFICKIMAWQNNKTESPYKILLRLKKNNSKVFNLAKNEFNSFSLNAAIKTQLGNVFYQDIKAAFSWNPFF